MENLSRIYIKIKKIFIILFMHRFYVRRVRLKPNKEIKNCYIGAIQPPDLEMWAVYDSNNSTLEPESLHPTPERANKECGIRFDWAESKTTKNLNLVKLNNCIDIFIYFCLISVLLFTLSNIICMFNQSH